MLWDFTCPDTLAPSHIGATSLEGCAAAEKAQRGKIAKYASVPPLYTFYPVAVETLGAWAKDSLEFVQNLGRRITDHTGEPKATGFLLQQISIAIQRGNAASIMSTLPSSNSLDEIYFVL